jgi:hypothetical protein
MIEDMTSTWWRHCASQISLSASEACYSSFVLTKFMFASWKKNALQSLPNQKYLGWDYKFWSASMPDTYKHKEKIQVSATFRDNAI